MEKQTKKSGLQDRLRGLCGRIPPGKRLFIVLAVLALCTALNLYITFKAVYNMGRETGRVPEIGHITAPGPLKPAAAQAACDSLSRKGGTP